MRTVDPKKESPNGWKGVDLDGTLAEYHGFVSETEIGKPIPLMVERIRRWLDEGIDVRIFTARVGPGPNDIEKARKAIEDWCLEHIGKVLPVTCEKDLHMWELWDDRCVQVVPNTAERVDCDEEKYKLPGRILQMQRENLAGMGDAYLEDVYHNVIDDIDTFSREVSRTKQNRALVEEELNKRGIVCK